MNNNYYTIEPQQNFQGENYNLWQPEALTNNKIQVNSGINSNWKYRQYMQKNANQIMKYNTMESINTSGNNPYTILNTNQTNTSPHLYKSIYDNNDLTYLTKNSDLKQDYLKKEQMKSRMVSPYISTNF
jgi:hypothetical protein